MKIEFSNRTFMAEHGKAPKGYGYWLFSFEGYEFGASGTLATAKKACREEIKRLAPAGYSNTVYVEVMP